MSRRITHGRRAKTTEQLVNSSHHVNTFQTFMAMDGGIANWIDASCGSTMARAAIANWLAFNGRFDLLIPLDDVLKYVSSANGFWFDNAYKIIQTKSGPVMQKQDLLNRAIQNFNEAYDDANSISA